MAETLRPEDVSLAVKPAMPDEAVPVETAMAMEPAVAAKPAMVPKAAVTAKPAMAALEIDGFYDRRDTDRMRLGSRQRCG
ncbi:MAG: hypothetical protein AAGL24_16730 [Pseudomonadota bacterium]